MRRRLQHGRAVLLEKGQLLVVLLHQGDGVDVARLMPEDAGAVKEEPGDGEPDDDGDVDGLAEAGAGTLVVERIEQVDDLMLLQFAVAAGAQLEGLACPSRCLVCGRVSRRLLGLVWVARRFGEELKDGHRRGLAGRFSALLLGGSLLLDGAKMRPAAAIGIDPAKRRELRSIPISHLCRSPLKQRGAESRAPSRG